MCESKIGTKWLGNSGIQVSELCLGTMTFGRAKLPGNCQLEESIALMDLYSSAGGRFLDTANVYSDGDSEEIVGTWLNRIQKRDDYVVASKVRFATGKEPNDLGLSRRHIIAAVEASLKRLNTPYIDLYQVHCWDAGVKLEETMRTLNDLVRCGKVRYIGASNYLGWQLQKAQDLAKYMGLESFCTLQQQYSLLCRYTEWDCVPVCENENVGILAWSPLKGGWLSGKFQRAMEAPPAGSRVEWAEKTKVGLQSCPGFSDFADERVWRTLDALHKISSESGHSCAQVALRWLMQRPGVCCPIVGAKTISQLTDLIGACGWELTPQQMLELNEASAVAAPYPWEMINRVNATRAH